MFVLLPFLLPFLPFYALELFFNNIFTAIKDVFDKVTGIFPDFLE